MEWPLIKFHFCTPCNVPPKKKTKSCFSLSIFFLFFWGFHNKALALICSKTCISTTRRTSTSWMMLRAGWKISSFLRPLTFLWGCYMSRALSGAVTKAGRLGKLRQDYNSYLNQNARNVACLLDICRVNKTRTHGTLPMRSLQVAIIFSSLNCVCWLRMYSTLKHGTNFVDILYWMISRDQL
jgi:hypothetical protein